MIAVYERHSASKTARPLRWPALAIANHPNLAFWLSFVLLNGLLFLPLYLFNRETSSFLPVPGAAGQSWRRPAQLLLWRNNLDIFRLSLELTLLAALWVNVRWLWQGRRPRVFRALVTLVYVLALSYAIYESIFLSLYQIDPVFYAQYRQTVDGVQYVVEHLNWPWTIYAGGALLLLALIAAVSAPDSRADRRGAAAAAEPLDQAGYGVAGAVGRAFVVRFWLTAGQPPGGGQQPGRKLEQNVAASLALRDKIAVFDSQRAAAGLRLQPLYLAATSPTST